MALGLTYRMQVTDIEGVLCICDISDVTTIGTIDENTVIQIEGTGTPLVLSTIDNDENKFTPIRAKQLFIQFLSTASENLNNFVTDKGDNAFRVHLYNPNNNTIFLGGLVINDINQDFLDDDTARTVELKATDGLGLLHDIPVTDKDGVGPRGYNQIIYYISQALKKTGQTLPINVMNNLMLVSHQTQPAYDVVSMNAKSFEDLDWYEVLERILGEECFLTQWNGEWWIKRVDEYDSNVNYFDTYTANGTFQSTTEGVTFTKTIGYNLPIELIQPAALVSADRPHSFVRETFNFDFPREIIDNGDFSRGSFYTLINPYFPFTNYANMGAFPSIGDSVHFYRANDTGNYYRWSNSRYELVTATAFHIDDWTMGRYQYGNVNAVATTSKLAYIKRIYALDYEIERYVQIENSNSETNPFVYLRSNAIPIGHKDQFRLSVDVRYTSTFSDVATNAIGVMLLGENGRTYAASNLGIWIDVTGNNGTSLIFSDSGFSYTNSDQKTNWQNITANVGPAPVGGDMYIYLNASYKNGADVHYANFTAQYLPYINGSYQKYSGQYSQVSQPGDFKAKIDNQIYISDSPKKLFKGALFIFTAGSYQLAGNWYNGGDTLIRNVLRTNPAYQHPLGYIQAYSVWNQYRRSMRLFEATLSGIDSTSQLPDLLHTYTIADLSPHTTNKRFILLHYEMNLYACTWKGFFAEVFDYAKGKNYSNDFAFRIL